MQHKFEEGDIVLCTVTKIIGTHVFVEIDIPGEKIEGNIIFSEIAPGRIRNIRDYVVPKKKIVCKVLRIHGDRVELSLRRVTKKEKKELLEKYKQEKTYINIFKKITGEKAEKIIDEITKKQRFYDFVEKLKENPQKIEEKIGKEKAQQFLKIITSQKKKKAIIKKIFNLTSNSPEGIILIKDILNLNEKNVQIKHISAGKYSIKTEAEDIKKADNYLKEILSEIEKKAKKQEIAFNTLGK